jgi:hypothetical protein
LSHGNQKRETHHFVPIAGLLTALLSEGAVRCFSWLALGAPVTAWFFMRRKWV